MKQSEIIEGNLLQIEELEPKVAPGQWTVTVHAGVAQLSAGGKLGNTCTIVWDTL